MLINNIKIESSITNIKKFDVKDYENKYEVTKKVLKLLKEKYLSTNEIVKQIINLDTGMKIEIRQKGIRETFGNDKYYKNLPLEIKKAKIATMEYLAKMIKYGKVRSQEAKNYHDINSKVIYAYLESSIYIDHICYIVNIDIRKSPKGDNRFYIHSLSVKRS
ncbi:MAG: hypothetical protein IKF17_05485 [Clostridia bacterium]|nr:hypothetical protein [Clostridia bacterium]